MKKRGLTTAFAIVFALATAVSVYGADSITVCGTGDSQQLLRILGKAYEAAHPGTTIDVPDSIGSGGGVKSTAKGKCELGRVARPIKDKEKKYNLSYSLFAFSPVVFAANPSIGTVNTLTTGEIIGIFSGSIRNWKEVGGPDSNIYVAIREPGDSSRSVLEKKLPGFRDIKELAGKVVHSTPENIETISRHASTIGFGPLAMVKGTNLKVIMIDGTAPTNTNVMNGTYNTVTPFGIIWKGKLQGLAKKFYTYLFSEEAKAIMVKQGAVPAAQ